MTSADMFADLLRGHMCLYWARVAGAPWFVWLLALMLADA